MSQGVISDLRGDKFAAGFASGLVGSVSGHISEGIPETGVRAMIAMVSGYISAEAAGGDGIQGALNAAVVFLYNDAAQEGNGVIGYDSDGVPIFDESHPRFHSYYGSNTCAKGSGGCTYANAKAGLLRYPAPGASGEPVSDEQSGYAFGFGMVRHEISDNGLQVINVTEDFKFGEHGRHLLHPGIVLRWVTQDMDSVTIHTYGEGTGIFPKVNNFFSEPLWRSVDEKIFNYMSNQ